MIDMIKMTVVLTVISCAAALLIAVTNSKTALRISEQRSMAEQESLLRVMPDGVTITENRTLFPDEGDSSLYWVGVVEQDTVYAFRVADRGYSSTIVFMVCLDGDGTVVGMTILEQSETPGLGSRLQEVSSTRYLWNGFGGEAEISEAWFTGQFRGISVTGTIGIEKTAGEWHTLDDGDRRALVERNSVTAITGSTISTQAVTGALTGKARLYLQAIKG